MPKTQLAKISRHCAKVQKEDWHLEISISYAQAKSSLYIIKGSIAIFQLKAQYSKSL